MPCRKSVLDLLQAQQSFDVSLLPDRFLLGIDYYCSMHWPHAEIVQQVHIDFLTELALEKLQGLGIALSADEFRLLRQTLAETLNVNQALRAVRPKMDFGLR